MTTYELLREAILGRRQVWAVYHGLPRAFRPHILGAKGSERHCLGYQFAGESTSGAITPGLAGQLALLRRGQSVAGLDPRGTVVYRVQLGSAADVRGAD